MNGQFPEQQASPFGLISDFLGIFRHLFRACSNVAETAEIVTDSLKGAASLGDKIIRTQLEFQLQHAELLSRQQSLTIS